MIEKSVVIMENIREQFDVLLDTQRCLEKGVLNFNKEKKRKRSDEYINEIIRYYHDESPLILNQIKVNLKVLFSNHETILDKYDEFEELIDDIEIYSSNKTMVENYFTDYTLEEMIKNLDTITDKINQSSTKAQNLIAEILITEKSVFDTFR